MGPGSCRRQAFSFRDHALPHTFLYGENMKLYSCITGPDDETFCKRVSDKLNRGWQLHGGPTLTYDGKTVIAGQALVKEVEGEVFTMDTKISAY
jgi:hypothetical protein